MSAAAFDVETFLARSLLEHALAAGAEKNRLGWEEYAELTRLKPVLEAKFNQSFSLSKLFALTRKVELISIDAAENYSKSPSTFSDVMVRHGYNALQAQAFVQFGNVINARVEDTVGVDSKRLRSESHFIELDCDGTTKPVDMENIVSALFDNARVYENDILQIKSSIDVLTETQNEVKQMCKSILALLQQNRPTTPKNGGHQQLADLESRF